MQRNGPFHGELVSESRLILMARESIHRLKREPHDPEGDSAATVDEWEKRLRSVFKRRAPSNIPPRDRATNLDARADDGNFPDGARLGRFRLVRQLGHGGFGVVFLAFDPRLQRDVALKLPRPELLCEPKWRKKFLHEARAAAALDHPGITAIYEVGNIGPACYISSAYCDGPTLSAWQAENAPVPVHAAAELLAKVADAVQHAHSRGVLHRDLKPANILLKLPNNNDSHSLPTPQVSDFGLASRERACGSRATPSGLAGTVAYMAPEQTFEEPSKIGTATDIYALGIMLFELIAGRPPFVATTESELITQIRVLPPPSLSVFRRNVPRDLEAICRKCLAKEPNDRYESAAEVARDLKRFLAEECVQARPLAAPLRFFRWCKRRPLTATLLTTLALALACGGSFGAIQWQRAEVHLDRAREAVVDLGWAIDDAVFWQGENWQPNQADLAELTRRYARLLEGLDDGKSAGPVEAAAVCFIGRVDALQGKFEPALSKLRQSVAIWRSVVRNDPTNMLHRHALARTLHFYGILLLTIDDRPDGLHHFEREKLFGWFDANGDVNAAIISDYADLLFAKGERLRSTKRRGDAARHLSAAVDILHRLAGAAPENPDHQFRIYQAEVRLNSVQRPESSPASPYELRLATLNGLRALVKKHPERPDFRTELADVALWMATNSQRYGQSENLELLLREAITTLDVLIDKPDCPANAKRSSARAWLRLAQILANDNRADEAVAAADHSLQAYVTLAADRSVNALQAAHAYNAAAGVYRTCGSDVKAMHTYKCAVTHFQKSQSGRAQSHRVHLQYADAWCKLAELHGRDGSEKDARKAYENAITVLEKWRGAAPREPRVAAQIKRLKSTVSQLTAERKAS